ncbi:hypothetical protein CTZ27_15015 [Streptomyces griseocarneus]|nr:hypothetical protein CTZ27_15015 [Streptomyces griseocarneus]
MGHALTATQTMKYVTVIDVIPAGEQVQIKLADGRSLTISREAYEKVGKDWEAQHVIQRGTLVPPTTLPGDCGSSWVTIGFQNTSSRPYRMNTGFTTDSPATSYDWWVRIYGPGSYYYQYESSGNLFFRHKWNGGHTGDGPGGRWEADLDTQSWAVTASGVCSSAGPIDSQYL